MKTSGVVKKRLTETLLIVPLAVFLFTNIASASQWAKAYGVNRSEGASSVRQTSDGGYIVAGKTYTGTYTYAFLILKLNSDGTVVWQKTYSRSSDDQAYAIQQTSDEGYIVVGQTRVSTYNSDIWVLKLNSDGTIAWQKTYGGSSNDNAYSIRQTSDGGYIMACNTTSFGEGYSDAWVLKLNSDGTIAWQKTYGGSGGDETSSILQTSDGGYIMAGQTTSFGGVGPDFWVLKLDTSGSFLWQRTYGVGGEAYAHSIQQTSNGGYIIAGYTESGGGDVWVLKLGINGEVQWQKTYGGSDYDEAKSIQQTSDGGYIVTGYTYSFGGGLCDIWILKLDVNGILQWQKTYGGEGFDGAFSIQQTTDNSYIAAGYTESFGLGYGGISSDLWVLKLDSNGDVPDCPIIGTSNAVVNDTNATVSATTVTGIDTSVSPQTSTATVTDINATVTEICYYEPSFPDISVNPASHDFGSINMGGTSTPQTFTLSNTGTADLHVSGMTLSDTTNYILDVNGGSSPCGSTSPTITPNSSCTVTVTFNPSSAGQKDTNLTIDSDDPDTPLLNMPLSGIGVAPTPNISVSPTSLNFAQVIVQRSSTKTVTVSNIGEADLTIGTIIITGTNASLFSKLNDNCSGKTVAPSSNCTVDVRFSPTLTGKKSATLRIPSNDPDTPTVNVPLSGKGAKVVVTWPNGGEFLESGKTWNITWQTSATVGPVAKSILSYTVDGGVTWKTMAIRTGNLGWYPWEVPWVSSARCKIRVVLKGATGATLASDKSDSNFTIKP